MPLGDAPAGPRKGSDGRNASSASSPSRGGYNSARSGGNISSNGLGLTTGSTIHGNTAFGPAGGMAQGYATNSRVGSGMGPSMGTFSNFRNLDGSAMFGGGLQNRAVAARNPQQALGMLQALQAAQASRGTLKGRVGGLLDGEDVTVGPTTVVPRAAIPPTITGPWPGQSTLLDLIKRVVDPAPLAPRRISGPWPGQSAVPPNPAVYTPRRISGPWPGQSAVRPNPAVFNPDVFTFKQKSDVPSMPAPTGEESIR